MKLIICTLISFLFFINSYGQTAQEYAEKGYLAIQNQDYSGGLEFFSKAIQIDPNEESFYHNRAVCYDALAKYQNAITDFNKALLLDNSVDNYNGIGITYTNLKNYNEAIKYFKLALAVDTNNVETYYNIGYANGNQKKYQQSIISFNKAIEINPAHLNSLHGRAISYFALLNYKEALKDFNKIITLTPNDSEIISYRAKCYYELQEFDNAINDYSILLSTEPNDLYWLSQRANCYHLIMQYHNEINDYTKSLYLLKQGADPNSLISNTYWYRGNAYLLLEDYKSAILDFNEYIKNKQDDNDVYFLRAISRMMVGDKLGACEDYKMAQKYGFSVSYRYKQLLKNDPNYLDGIFGNCQ